MHEETPHGEEPAADRQSSTGDTRPPVNLSLVMAVAFSAINRIVVSRIIERAGLKVVACGADAAPGMLQRSMPCVVVAEEGSDEDGQSTLRRAMEERARSAAGLPLVIALARPGSALAANPGGGGADAVVAMPFTPDSLAPVILRLVERARGLVAS